MRKILFILTSILFCLSVAACGKKPGNTGYYDEQKEKTIEELGSVSDDEKRILSRGGYYDKDRIYDGKLLDNEIEKVKRIRGAKEYLAEKYPGQKFQIDLYEDGGDKSVSPTGIIGDDTMWISENGENSLKWVKVKETENGYEYYDNWITEKPESDAEIENLEKDSDIDTIGKADFTGVVNPVHESTYEEIKELDGIDMRIPSAATNREYVRIVTDAGVIDEVSFYYGQIFYVGRIKKTLSPEDISGTYYDWTYTSSYNLPNNTQMTTDEAPTIYGTDDGQGLMIWYKDGQSYSLFIPIDSDDEKLFEMYQLLMNPS